MTADNFTVEGGPGAAQGPGTMVLGAPGVASGIS